ncbi:replication factor C large subunit [Salinibaculum rarum]|uniref:replication factor C large subunit n=1 Tax=Salinibaculum rarum TaxID=3058903 RepID=UPI00265D6668|nr:replication factor C large subunit [Salinibaculum sp. KK48]
MDWTQEHRPEKLSEIRGNDKAVKKLRKWADKWPDNGRAALLYGKPGIGKTTAAHALANEHGWETIEMNASETRTKDVVSKIAGGAAANGTLTQGTTGRRLVILDEADSLHGNSDRGGSKAMTDVVKDAEQPVVLIANDFYEMSNALRNKCEDIEFDTGNINQSEVARFLREICEAEDVEYTQDALKAIAGNNTDDIRGAVNDLQATASGLQGTLTEDDVPTGSRDKSEDLFPFMDSLFQEADPEEARSLAYSVDETPDDLFAWIEDNIVKEYDANELYHAYDHLARADQWLGRVRATQNYGYWKYVTDQMTSGVAASRRGRHSGWTRYGPPSYWQQLGRTKSTRSTRDSIAQRIADTSHVSMGTARRDLMPYLGALTHHCKPRDLTVSMAATYDLTEKEISFITGSGEDTNKVESIVEDAEKLESEAAIEHGRGSSTALDSFDKGTADSETNDGEGATSESPSSAAADNNGQATLGDVGSDTDSEPPNTASDDNSDDAAGEQTGLGQF